MPSSGVGILARGQRWGGGPMTPAIVAGEALRPPLPEDQRLPQLAWALDSEHMKDYLPFDASALDSGRLQVAYIRYKPATNCIVLYELLLPGEAVHWAYAKLYARGADPHRNGSAPGCRYYPAERMAVVGFPADLEMPSLQMAMGTAQGQQLLDRVVRTGKRLRFGQQWGRWSAVRYKPERRCLMQGNYVGRGGEQRPFYARFYGPGEGLQSAEWHRHLSSLGGPELRIPRYLGSSARRRVLLVRGCKGKPLREFFARSSSELGEALERTAAALAHWHRLPPPAGAPATNPAGELWPAAEAVEALWPHRTGALGLARELAARFEPAATPCLLHGDFYYDQVLLDRRAVSFLDLDEVSVGDPLRDVANFCAHIEALALQGEIADSLRRWMISRFVAAYEQATGEPVRSNVLAPHLSAGLLKLSVLPFRRFDRDWPQQIQRVVNRAIEIAGNATC